MAEWRNPSDGLWQDVWPLEAQAGRVGERMGGAGVAPTGLPSQPPITV